jgi:hypothetical protein
LKFLQQKAERLLTINLGFLHVAREPGEFTAVPNGVSGWAEAKIKLDERRVVLSTLHLRASAIYLD